MGRVHGWITLEVLVKGKIGSRVIITSKRYPKPEHRAVTYVAAVGINRPHPHKFVMPDEDCEIDLQGSIQGATIKIKKGVRR